MKNIVLFLLLTILILPCSASSRIDQIINNLKSNYDQIKTAQADITLDFSLMLLGCAGTQRWKGSFYYKYPDKIRASIDSTTYYAQGNKIRKIDDKGKRYYIQLLNAIDMSAGFHAGVLKPNFDLKIIKDGPDEIVLEGLPKPGVLKNTQKVIFFIDPKRKIIEKFNIYFKNCAPSGTIFIDHQKINNIWAPIGFHGKTAIEVAGGSLVGLQIKLIGTKVRINAPLSNSLFNPGF